MQEVTFTLQTITPLFLAGADQTKAELRAPSFRGLMRYWQRALVGGLVGTDVRGLEKVMEAETAIFGATDTGSAVSIKVSNVTNAPREFTEQVSVNVGGKWLATGKGYLLWSMVKSGRADRGNLKPARWYFPTGTSFQVTLSTRGTDDTKHKQALAAFWLLAHLGAVGSRSRRCAGSISVQSFKGNVANFQFGTPEDVNDLQMQIKQGIEYARTLYSIKPAPMRDAMFDVLSPNACAIRILYDNQPWLTPEAAMKAIGESLQKYRSGIFPLPRRKIFGLPLRDVSNARRASPLLLRVTELQGEKGKQYVGVAVLFKTAGRDAQGRSVSTKDYDLIEEWFNTFSGKEKVTL